VGAGNVEHERGGPYRELGLDAAGLCVEVVKKLLPTVAAGPSTAIVACVGPEVHWIPTDEVDACLGLGLGKVAFG